MYYLKNTNFWMFGLFFFFYFFIMGAYFPFFPIWLHDINHISKSDTGIIFAAISLFSLLFQPLFGLLSDKLGLRKYLLWIITGMLVMFAPGSDSNLLIVFYVQIMPDDLVMQLHRF